MVDVINPSLTASIGTNQPNLLGSFYDIQAIRNMQTNNALQQQQLQSQQRKMQVLQASTRPDGSVDYGKATVGMFENQVLDAPEIANQFAQHGLIDAHTQLVLLQQAQEKRQAFDDAMGGVARMDNPTHKDMSDALMSNEMLPFIPGGARGVAAAVAQAPPEGPDFKRWLQIHAAQNAQGLSAVNAGLGAYSPEAFTDAAGNKYGGFISNVNGVRPAGWASTVSSSGGVPVAPGAAAPAAPATGAPVPQQPVAPSGPVRTQLGPAALGMQTDVKEYKNSLDIAADQATKSNMIMGELEQALKGFKSGAGTEHYIAAAKLLQSLGVRNDIVDKVAGGNLSSAQEFNKLALQYSTGQLRSALLPGAGRLTNTEFSAFRDANPNWDSDPRTIAKLLAFQRQLNGLDIKKQLAFGLAQNQMENGEPMPKGLPTLASFEPWWTQKLIASGIIDPDSGHTKALLSNIPTGQ